MKSIVKIFAGISILAAAASCQQFEVDTQMTPEKFAASVKLVSDVLDSYTLSADNPQSVIFNVTANTPWTITGNTEWLSVTPSSSGASGLIADVTVTAQPNTTLEDRTATLTLKADSYECRVYTINITQYRKGKLFVTPIYKDYVATGGPLTFTIETNQAWEVRSSEGWISFGKASGDPDPDGKPITVIATAEPSDVLERTATITVVAGDEEESFEVSQKGKFEVNGLASEFSAAGGEQTFTIKTDLPWEVSSDQAWLSFDKTSGTGDGSAVEVKATAAANDGAIRKATVTVKAGGIEKTFEAAQGGVQFNIVLPGTFGPEGLEIARVGGEIILEINTTLDWSVKVDNAAFTAEKVDANHFKVSAPWNNLFIARKAVATVESPSGATDSVNLFQDTNFTLENCELLEDGSVKLSGANGSRVYFKDEQRMVGALITMGNKEFHSSAQFWFTGSVGEVNIYNQLSLDGNTRVRTDGNMANGTSSYKNAAYSISKDVLNAMNTYEFKFFPNASDVTMMDMVFAVNGNELVNDSRPNPFYYDRTNTASYYFGFYSATSDGTWYEVKSCDVTLFEENYGD